MAENFDFKNGRGAIAVFGGARATRDSAQYAEAYRVGMLLAQHGLAVVNGGYTGAMEASAKGAFDAGGRVIGVTSKLFSTSVLNDFVHEEIATDDLYNRIRELVRRSDGYIVLRGGIGTLAELHIVWNLAALEPGFEKPIVLIGDFWRNVIAAYEAHLVVKGEHTRYLYIASTPEEGVRQLTRALRQFQRQPSDGDDPLPPTLSLP